MNNSVQREGTHEQQCTDYRGRVFVNNSVQREGTHEQQCTEGGYS